MLTNNTHEPNDRSVTRSVTFASRLGMGVSRFDGLVWLNSAAIGAPNMTRRGVSIPMSGAVTLPPPPPPPAPAPPAILGVLTPPVAAAVRPPAAAGERGPLATLSALAVASGESRELGDALSPRVVTAPPAPPPPRERLRELRQLLRRPRADSGAVFEAGACQGRWDFRGNRCEGGRGLQEFVRFTSLKARRLRHNTRLWRTNRCRGKPKTVYRRDTAEASRD